MSERTMTDAEVLDKIAERYRAFGELGIFDDMPSTIESIGDWIESTGREAWCDDPNYYY